jgi:hypothetical protein
MRFCFCAVCNESCNASLKRTMNGCARRCVGWHRLQLYELGRLSSGRAAELAGLPRVEFLLALGRYKVFPFEAELNDLKQTHARGHQ